MDEIIFEIIANSGEAKSLIYEAIEEAEKGNFDRSDELIEEANEALNLVHYTQSKLIADELNGKPVEISLLFIHAQDHLSSAIELNNLAQYIIKMYKK